jgi:integrase
MNPIPRRRRARLTDKGVVALKRKSKRYIVSDPEMRGHYVRIPPEGPMVFAAVARNKYGKQVWATLGTTADMKIDEARERAREAIRRIKDGLPAFEAPPPKPASVAEVAENWLRRHVEKNKLRTADEIRRVLNRYILPYWKDRNFVELRRSDIAALLDAIEDNHGARQADVVLTTLRSIAGWVQSRDDVYTPPFAKGMRRASKKEGERAHILNDGELRRLWLAAGKIEQIGPLARLLLLTAQRRQKLLTLRWDDIDRKGVWTIRTEEREKGNPGALQLPELALDIIQAQPRFVGNPYVFASQTGGPWDVSSKLKRRLDEQSGVKGWRLHDLRRTARSLMSRAGVQSEHAERVLGHAIGGVEGIYNRHDYDAEKADALRKLAALVERIVTPPGENVVALEHARA